MDIAGSPYITLDSLVVGHGYGGYLLERFFQKIEISYSLPLPVKLFRKEINLIISETYSSHFIDLEYFNLISADPIWGPEIKGRVAGISVLSTNLMATYPLTEGLQLVGGFSGHFQIEAERKVETIFRNNPRLQIGEFANMDQKLAKTFVLNYQLGLRTMLLKDRLSLLLVWKKNLTPILKPFEINNVRKRLPAEMNELLFRMGYHFNL